jgi:D-alanyl-D-alanine carboxypeptidase (penicillin-binding protein 5/6)
VLCCRFAIWAAIAATSLHAGAIAAAQAPDRFPDLAAAYLVQIDGNDLWAGNADARLPPASLTKIMTALVVLENYRPDDLATVSAGAAGQGGTRIRLGVGEKISVGALLTATLMVSANDACAALAEHQAGSVQAFVARMNERAAALGLANTRFANPCGLDAPDHYSSVRDLARIARTAMAHPEFAAIVKRRTARIATADGKRGFALRNRNALIGNYEPAIGIKTGYTGKAGKCLAALAEKDGKQVLVIMLNAKSRWWDTIGLIERAFDAGGRHVPQ